MSKHPRYEVEFLYRPGAAWSDAALARLTAACRGIGARCFHEIPDYQVFRGTRAEFTNKVITLARGPDGEPVGFCSAVLLPIAGFGDVLHLGLTCVHPAARGARLTHALTAKLITHYLLRHRPLDRVWCTSVACVLSSLGNMALHFSQVYPSPFYDGGPSPAHVAVASTIGARYRDQIFIRPEATLDLRQFVFRGSVHNTVFQKQASDPRFFHRDAELNHYYANLMNFAAGDEVIQVGHISLLALLRYRLFPRTPGSPSHPALPSPRTGFPAVT